MEGVNGCHEIQHNYTQHNGTWHKHTQHNGLLCDTLNINDIQRNVFGVIMLFVIMLSVAINLMLC